MTGRCTRWERWLPGSGGMLKVVNCNLHSFQLFEIIQVLDSISWVRCASGNVCYLYLYLCMRVFVFVYLYLCICICVFVYLCICMCILTAAACSQSSQLETVALRMARRARWNDEPALEENPFLGNKIYGF